MKVFKKAMVAMSIKNFADKLDKQDLEFIKEITDDPRFDRIMGRVSNGEAVAETVRKEVATRLN